MKKWAIMGLALVALGGAVGASILATRDERSRVVRPADAKSDIPPDFSVAPDDSPEPDPSASPTGDPEGSSGRIVPLGGSDSDSGSGRGPQGSTINAREGAFAESSEGQDQEEAEREAEEEEAEREAEEEEDEEREDRRDE